ncbi:MAG: hypothetical protein D6691_04605 [Candidatus Hydrogenedentota bacterium]|nr:MAG: hypothetical protein D6691_04605 [Candidatus Hydrogenedentota bacterium]
MVSTKEVEAKATVWPRCTAVFRSQTPEVLHATSEIVTWLKAVTPADQNASTTTFLGSTLVPLHTKAEAGENTAVHCI